MTVALGILAGTGVVIAADTEESYGEHKLDVLKTKTVFPPDSGFAMTGAGCGWYIDAIHQKFEHVYRSNRDSGPEELKKAFEFELEDFYQRHVIPFDNSTLDFQLIIGVQRSDLNSLWVTRKNTIQDVYRHESVGVGDIQARMVLDTQMCESVAEGVVLACCAVYQAKEHTQGCGKSTTVECIHNGYVHHIFPDVIEAVEKWFGRYLRVTGNTLGYCLGRRYLEEIKHAEKIAEGYRECRKEAESIMASIMRDLDRHSRRSTFQTLTDQQ